MKIAIFTDTFAPDVNGVAKTLKRYTEYLDENGIDYRVFAPKSSNKDLFSKHVLRFTSLPFFMYPECRLALPNIPFVKEELLSFKPDIIHVATPFNIGLCGLHFAKKLNIPIVGSYHTDFDKYLQYYDMQFLSKVLWKYMHWFHRPLRKIFVPSVDTKNQLQKQGFTNLSIWPRGVDQSTFHDKYDQDAIRKKYNIKEKYILLYVGRISPEKDVMLLPEINQLLLHKNRNDIHWLIVGDGPLKNDLESSASSNMTFTGFLTGEDLAQIYASSDLFVFPSATETFGNVVLESLACGTPVIGVNEGGVRSIIQQDVTGMLCNQKDSEGFVEAITALLADKNKMDMMGYQGRKYALTQSWDAIFGNLVAEYEALLVEEEYRVLA
ncbi:glycosyltransferase family 4 protein [Oceanobacillus saliphilus]|uniref:glycosyltransferase family 4 protein n=1 Tax=Oceanobacillus saliphilus TaxID=2925834 RepID=UPI00201D5125|nr:glycosyltransferase family 1 protein [Oceanobacillus saliphilus]